MSSRSSCDIGLIGLAVMGRNLVLNMESKGFRVAVFNRTTAVTRQLVSEWTVVHKNIEAGYTLKEFVGLLARPRKIMLMVKAGPAVDTVIRSLLPLLDRGDLIIDGGNSLFSDTMIRETKLAKKGLYYIGTGVSGGEEGALKGPAIMPGGDQRAYQMVEPIFTRIAAQVAENNHEVACCTYVGPNGAGHFVKMVHNGIEYGDMQLICEAYALMSQVLGQNATEIQSVFANWNRGELESYLIEITADILGRTDPETGQPLVDVILDKAGQKGTGKWTVHSALDLGITVPTINAAVEARVLSSQKNERVEASKQLAGPNAKPFTGDRPAVIQAIHNALYASKIMSYAQGFSLLQAGSDKYGWDLKLGEIAAIWRGGCIIRARFLNRITDAYRHDPQLLNLLLDPFFKDITARTQADWRTVVTLAKQHGVAVPAFSASLGYFDQYRSARLPQNLLQAQRDYFGAHTYERIDQPGTFHTEWTPKL